MSDRAIQIINTTDFGTLAQMADIATSSGYVKVNKAQAMFIMLKGTELGISPLQALDGINIIQGKPTISPQLMLALINRSSEMQDIKIESNDAECVVTMVRRGRTSHTERFSLDDARKMGLTGKDNYVKQSKTMLKWRAISACARIVFPDVIQGVYTPDEMGADVVEDDAGDIVLVKSAQEPQPAQIPAIVEPPAQPEPEHNPDEWINGNVKAWVDKWTGQGMTTDQLMKALGIEGRWGNYKGTVSEADKAVEAYRNAKIIQDDAPATDEKHTPDEAESRAAALARINGEMVLIRNAEKREYVRGNGHKAGYKWDGFADITETNGMVFPVRISLFPEDIEAIEEKNHVWPKTDGPVNVTVTLDTTDRNMIRIKDVLKKPNPFGKVDAASQAAFDAIPSANETTVQPTLGGMPSKLQPV